MQIHRPHLKARSHLLIGILLIGLLLFFLLRAALYPFLAPNHPPYSGWMVIEGWIGDAALGQAMTLYEQGHYEGIYTTGVPLDTGSPLLAYQNYAEMTTARLIALGIHRDEIRTAAADYAQRDRTYQAALALREAFALEDIHGGHVHLISIGPHARRSRLLFRAALGERFTIGISALPDSDYPPQYWYRYSAGLRAVLSEALAYLHALWSPPS